MLRATVALVVSVGAACSVAPAAETLQAIAPGVRIFGTSVGGLTMQPARNRIQFALDRPIPLVFGGKTFSVAPSTFGVKASVDRALAVALDAQAHSKLHLRISYDPAAVDSYVAALAQTYYRPPVPAEVIGANAHGPIIRPGKVGLAVEQNGLRAAIEQQLAAGTRHPLVLLMSAVLPAHTATAFGPVIVVDREANTLRLYSTKKLVRTFPVATGQSIYPTPEGIFKIVVKQMNPWWYPPTYDSWAKGLKPVPPGPDNPLGTRWMGLSVPGVGIHGTDEPTSIGYSESHGCIRMQVPDAEWLFTHVAVGTPVVIQ
ncbi:MAG TPA: L,D-transpeptidase family protein [Gaiellaceae bacterium]